MDLAVRTSSQSLTSHDDTDPRVLQQHFLVVRQELDWLAKDKELFSEMPTDSTTAVWKPSFRLIPIPVGVCPVPKGDKETLIIEKCAEAISQGVKTLKEVELEEGASFLFLSRMCFYGINFSCCLAFISFFGAKDRLEKQMERRRDRLQQELDDPLLRQCLERKVKQLPEEDRETFIPAHEARLAKWDSSGMALRRLRTQVRRFRNIIVFAMALTTVIYLALHLSHVSSMTAYLEIMILSMGMLTVTYAIPDVNQSNDSESVKDAAVPSSMTESLLATDDPESP